jgi:hypothetical protein
MKKILNEISSVDAWKLYDGKVPEDLYKLVMSGTQKMTPFHRMLLDKYISETSLPGMEIPSAKETVARCVSKIINIWNKLHPDSKQALIKDSSDGTFKNINIFRIQQYIENFKGLEGFSENYYSSNGLVIIYEDEKLLVTCTTTYASSKNNYGDSHWCTASDIFGNYNGFEMFRKYTNYDDDDSSENADECLIQFIDKNRRAENSFQIQYIDTGDEGAMCDFNDNEITVDDVIQKLSSIGEDYYEIKNKINFSKLIELTDSHRDKEYIYWDRKIKKAAEKIYNNFKATEQESKQKIEEAIKESCKMIYLKEGNSLKDNIYDSMVSFNDKYRVKYNNYLTYDVSDGTYSKAGNSFIFRCIVVPGNESMEDKIYEIYRERLGKTFIIVYQPDRDVLFKVKENLHYDTVVGKMLIASSDNIGYYALDLEKLEYLSINGKENFEYILGFWDEGAAAKGFFQVFYKELGKKVYYLVDGNLGKVLYKSYDVIKAKNNFRIAILTGQLGDKKEVKIGNSQQVNEAINLLKRIML